MSVWRATKFVAGASLLLLAVAFTIGCLLNSTAITEIRVRLKPGVEEPGDHHFLGVGDAEKLPDYLLQVRTKDGWQPVGTRLNTSASDWLSFPVTPALPVRSVAELQLVEDDKLENDVLEQLPVVASTFSGKQFDFQIATIRSFESGMEWFFGTPVGKAISLGITIAVIAYILAILGPSWPA